MSCRAKRGSGCPKAYKALLFKQGKADIRNGAYLREGLSIKGNNRRPSTYFARKLNKRVRCRLWQAKASKAQHILVIIFLLLFLLTQVATLLAWMSHVIFWVFRALNLV